MIASLQPHTQYQKPRLLVSATLPPIISFSSPEEPVLALTATLQYSKPVTVTIPGSPFYPVGNCLTLHDSNTGAAKPLPFYDVCFRNASPLKLIRSQKSKFRTLHPGEAHQISAVPFRPFGSEIYDAERIATLERTMKIRLWAIIGMHFLEVEKEYLLGVKEGLKLAWMEGDMKEMVIEDGEEGGAWRPARESLEVIPTESCHFRVKR